MVNAIHLDLERSHIGLESLDLSYLELSKEISVANESFALLFDGLSKLNKHEIKKPKYRESIKRRLSDIEGATGVSCESLMVDVEAIFVGTDYSAENILVSIGKLIKKIIDWVVTAIRNFFGRIKKFFTGGTVRKAQVVTNVAIVNSVTDSKTTNPKAVPDIINCTLPGITALICHSKKMTPKPGYKFNSEGLKKATAQAQADILEVVDKLSADLEIYLQALTGIADLAPAGLVNGLNSISMQLARAGGLRGLANNRFSAAGFRVVPEETQSKTGFMGLGYKLVSADDLIKGWKASSTEFTMTLKDYVPDLTIFSDTMTKIDSKIGIMSGKIESSSAVRTLRNMERSYEANRNSIESASQSGIHEAITDRLNLISTLVSMILRNVDTVGYYQDRFSTTHIKVYTLIAGELKVKQAEAAEQQD